MMVYSSSLQTLQTKVAFFITYAVVRWHGTDTRRYPIRTIDCMYASQPNVIVTLGICENGLYATRQVLYE